MENEKGQVLCYLLYYHCHFSSVTVKIKVGFWHCTLVYRAIKFQGKVAMLHESTNKANTFLRIWPAMGDYLKGGKEKYRMVTFQLVKQKSIDMKRVNTGGRFSIKALQRFSVQNFPKKLFI